MTTSIKSQGVLQPVLVRKAEDGGVVLVSGERRYRASQQAGLTSIPALFTEGDPVEIAVVENLLRENLTAIEEAEAIAHLRDTHNYRLSDLSGVLGKSESTLSDILCLTKLPDDIKDDCRNDPHTARAALLKVSKQPTAGKMRVMYKRLKASGAVTGGISIARVPRADSGVDLTFVRRFTLRIQALQSVNLTKEQAQTLEKDVVLLRTALKKTLKTMKLRFQDAQD